MKKNSAMMHCMRIWIYLDLLFIESKVKSRKEAKLWDWDDTLIILPSTLLTFAVSIIVGSNNFVKRKCPREIKFNRSLGSSKRNCPRAIKSSGSLLHIHWKFCYACTTTYRDNLLQSLTLYRPLIVEMGLPTSLHYYFRKNFVVRMH